MRLGDEIGNAVCRFAILGLDLGRFDHVAAFVALLGSALRSQHRAGLVGHAGRACARLLRAVHAAAGIAVVVFCDHAKKAVQRVPAAIGDGLADGLRIAADTRHVQRGGDPLSGLMQEDCRDAAQLPIDCGRLQNPDLMFVQHRLGCVHVGSEIRILAAQVGILAFFNRRSGGLERLEQRRQDLVRAFRRNAVGEWHVERGGHGKGRAVRRTNS